MKQKIMDQSQFHEQISNSYDQMISWPSRLRVESKFFEKIIKQNKVKSSLDIGCSTGFHVVMLRRMGIDSSGIDSSPKMIEKAKANAIACGVNVEYILGDMTQLSRRFSEGFDLITCLGDTLAHVGNKKDVSRTLKEIQNCLNPNGLFVIQSLNYANIIKKKIRFLPPSLPPNLMSETQYFRTLDYTKGSFILNLTEHAWYKNKWAVSNFSTKITPYTKKELETLLKLAGLKQIQSYQNFNFEDYDVNETNLILVARKEIGKEEKLSSGNISVLKEKAIPSTGQQKKSISAKIPAKKSNAKKIVSVPSKDRKTTNKKPKKLPQINDKKGRYSKSKRLISAKKSKNTKVSRGKR
jgi:2-polyprenyl-3-methyl-5-hydroxy-6-metoxy-1,4-benzoquinol methylase